MENQGGSPKSLIASLENLDPAAVIQVIQLVDALLAQSRADLLALQQASSSANTAFTDATNAYNAAVAEKARIEGVISTGNSDLAAQEAVVSDATNAKNTAEGAKTQAQDTLDTETTRLDHEIATLVQVLNLLGTLDLRDWQTFQGAYYKYDDTPRTFADSRTFCQSFGAEIASVHSLAENEFVTGLIVDQQIAWLGADDTDGNNVYTWVDGTAWDYSNWYPGEPNGANTEKCLNIYSQASGRAQWNDLGCSGTHSVICKQ